MAKGKKQRKQGQDSDSEQELDNVEEIETTPVESAAGGKKGKKDRKKKKEAELEEAEKELEAIAAGEDPVADVKGEIKSERIEIKLETQNPNPRHLNLKRKIRKATKKRRKSLDLQPFKWMIVRKTLVTMQVTLMRLQ